MRPSPFPARYAAPTPSAQPDSFLIRLLAKAPSREAQEAILQAVDWDTPQVRIKSPWSEGSSRQETSLAHSHPLASVAALGDRSLFSHALGLAHEKGALVLTVHTDSAQKKGSSGMWMGDWVESKVLDTVISLGTPGMLHDLIDTLQKRLDATSLPLLPSPYMEPVSRIDKALLVLAHSQSRQRSQEEFQDMLEAIDRFYLLAVKRRYPFPGPHDPMVQEARQRVHDHALAAAAVHGNVAMAQAVLDMGHVQVAHSHVMAAMDSGGMDLALLLFNQSPAPGWVYDQQGFPDPADRSSEILQRHHIEEMLSWLATNLEQWRALAPDHPHIPFRKAQEGAADELLVALVDRYIKAPGASSRSPQLGLSVHTRMFLRLSEPQAQKAAQAFEGMHPSLEAWEVLAEYPNAPWARQMHARVADWDKDTLDTHLKDLGEEMLTLSASNIDGHAPLLPQIDAFARLWKEWNANPHLPALDAWVMETVKPLPEKHRAQIHRRLMHDLLPAEPAAPVRARSFNRM